MSTRQNPWFGYPIADLTELRIHGAGGTPVEEMLDSDTYVRVAGDDTAGFYRVPPPDKPTDLDPRDPRYAAFNLRYPREQVAENTVEGEVEAYHWGELSSGGGWRAFWVLLLPFAIINLAGWNAPRFATFTQRLVRLFGLIASVALTYWIVAISIGVLHECGPTTLCAERTWYLGFTGWGPFRAQPSRLALVGLALGVVVTFVLWWWPGRRTADRYERYTPRERDDSHDAIPGNQLSADGSALWYSERVTRRLAAAHVLAMLSSIAAGCFVIGSSTADTGRIFADSEYYVAYPRDPVAIVLLLICVVAVVACGVFVFAMNPFKEVDARENRRQRRRRDPGWAAFVVGLVLVIAGATWVWTTGVAGETSTLDPIPLTALNSAYQRYANTGFFVLAVLVLLVSLALFLVRAFDLVTRRRQTGRYGVGGFGPALLPITALVFLAAMVSGAILFIADVFGEPDYDIPDFENIAVIQDQARTALTGLSEFELSGSIEAYRLAELQAAIDAIGRYQDLKHDLGEPLIRLGREYYLIPLGFTAIVALLALIALLVVIAARIRMPWRNLLRHSRIDRPLVAAVNRTGRADTLDSRTLEKTIASDLRKPYRNRRLHALLVLPAVLGFVYLTAILIRGGWLSTRASEFDILLRPSIWLTVGVFTALAFVVRSHYAGGSTRGTLGGVWDIVTFWPRFYHPFAPPSYAVRSVPEIAERIRELTAPAGREDAEHEEGRRVVLSAHSQGVPTTLAAVSLIADPKRRNRIALLTHGSPTGMLYARFFPDYFDRARLDAIAASLESRASEPWGTRRLGVRWTNLWRLTDWTGGYAMGPSRDAYFPLVPLFSSAATRLDGAPGEAMYVDEAPALFGSVGEYRLTDPDPHSVALAGHTDPLPAPTGHGDYLHDRLYDGFRQVLVDALFVPATESTIDADSRMSVWQHLEDAETSTAEDD